MHPTRTPSCEEIADLLSELAGSAAPLIVGIDGRSGVGKSTLATALAIRLEAAVVEGDAFFAGGVAIHERPAEELADLCIDRPKLVGVIEKLKRGYPASYRAFDWEAFDGSLRRDPEALPKRRLYLVEGAYACHPDLHGLLDLKILITAAPDLRDQRLALREGGIGPWERQWHAAEDWYFSRIMPPEAFDLRVDAT